MKKKIDEDFCNTVYYNSDDQETRSVTSIRIRSDLHKKAKKYGLFDANFNLSNFVDQALEEFFSDEIYLKNRISFLKKQLKIAQKMLKNEQKMSIFEQKNAQKLNENSLIRFEKSLDIPKLEFWKKCLDAINKDSTFIKGQFRLYEYSFKEKINYEGFRLLLKYANELRNRGIL